jgi:Fur family transcriptional regulator, ferric uptake regulator
MKSCNNVATFLFVLCTFEPMEKRGIDIFKRLGIHATSVRTQMLGILEQAQQPLSTKEIEELMGPHADRVTVYRTLKLFVGKGLLHRIDVSDTLTAYRLTTVGNNGEHLHFHCVDCNQVYCMPQLPIGPIALPDGFAQIRNRLVVDGRCSLCNNNVRHHNGKSN